MVEAIYKRASVRAFTDEAVTDDQVRAALRAAMAAPSGGNQQPWEFFVVRDAEHRSRLSQVTKYAKPADAAPCVVLPACAPKACASLTWLCRTWAPRLRICCLLWPTWI